MLAGWPGKEVASDPSKGEKLLSTIEHDLERAPRSVLRRSVSVFVAFLLALASLVGVSQAAHATQGITSTILLGGEVYDGTAVVNEGQTITLRVQ